MELQAATDMETALRQALPELSIGLVHGRQKSAAKDKVMQQFKGGTLDLLVATTVIEVGVDVPNASLMIIENAERLGLAQLHQLRGRVGRGDKQSSCVLMYRAPLSQMARQRLAVLRNTNDGFEIARQDLELRGPGEVLGTRQTGMLQFRIADFDTQVATCNHYDIGSFHDLFESAHGFSAFDFRDNSTVTARLAQQVTCFINVTAIAWKGYSDIVRLHFCSDLDISTILFRNGLC